MKQTKNKTKKQVSEEDIDEIVESQAEDDAAWERPIRVRTAKRASLSLPPELAARAAFLARLHKAKNTEDWITHVIRERVELEEVAFTDVKREMSLRNGA